MIVDDEVTTTSSPNLSRIKSEISHFLSINTIYEAIPENIKILVFSNDLSVKDAIEAMISEDIYCSMIWNSETNSFTGIFTIRDFLQLINLTHSKINSLIESGKKWQNAKNLFNLLFHHNENIVHLDVIMENDDNYFNKSESSSTHSLDKLGGETNENVCPLQNLKDFFHLFSNLTMNDYYVDLHTDIYLNYQLISCSLDDNINVALKLLKQNHVHRIIVEDKAASQSQSKIPSGFISYESIFEYFLNNYYSNDSITLFDIPISEIDFIISKDLVTIDSEQNVISVINTFYENKISILPVTKQGNIIGIIFLRDLFFIFSNSEKISFYDKIDKFLFQLYEGIDDEPYGKDRVLFCKFESDTFRDVLEKMLISPEKKIIVTSDKGYYGVITVSDIFNIVYQE